MAAPAGNKFWQNRTRHGREKIFETPELMWAAAEEYFEWCDANPWMKKELMKSGDLAGKIIDVPTQRPYTINGLCIYLDANVDYFNQFERNLGEEDKGFSRIIKQIKEVIYTQKYEGAAVGAFNANIIARDLGLKDSSTVEAKVETVSDMSNLSDDELKSLVALQKKALGK